MSILKMTHIKAGLGKLEIPDVGNFKVSSLHTHPKTTSIYDQL